MKRLTTLLGVKANCNQEFIKLKENIQSDGVLSCSATHHFDLYRCKNANIPNITIQALGT